MLGVVVLGHGSSARRGEANRVVFAVSEMVKTKMGLELVEPAIVNRLSGLQSLAEAVKKLARQGADHIIVAPMFFAKGFHLEQDIPAQLAALEREYPQLTLTMAEHIGADERIADILVERTLAARGDKLK